MSRLNPIREVDQWADFFGATEKDSDDEKAKESGSGEIFTNPSPYTDGRTIQHHVMLEQDSSFVKKLADIDTIAHNVALDDSMVQYKDLFDRNPQ